MAGRRSLRRIGLLAAGLVVLESLILAARLYTADRQRPALETAYPGEFHVVDQVRFRLRDTGPRQGPTIIMLHGFGASLDTWEPWAQTLALRYRVIRVDLPGFGLTGPDPTGDYSDGRTVALLVGLMEKFNIERTHLIGNSLGGRIAWSFAAAHPDRMDRLVLVSPDGFASPGFDYGAPPDIPPVMHALPWAAPRSLLKANLAAAYAQPEALTDATLTRYSDLLRAPGERLAILERMRQTVLHEPRPILARIEAPTLLLWGEKDAMIPISNAADYQRHIPRVRLVRLPGLGHLPFEEDPARSLSPVERFLSTDTD